MKYILVITICILSSGVASAKCAAWTDLDVQKVQRASSIFVAKVVSAQAKDQESGGTLVYGQYRLLDVIKGSPSKNGTVQSSLSDVGIPLTPGFVYLFFTYGDSLQVDWCDGSRILKEFYAPYPNKEKNMLHHIKDLLASQKNSGNKVRVRANN